MISVDLLFGDINNSLKPKFLAEIPFENQISQISFIHN